MNERFFYKWAKEIKEIFATCGIPRCKILFKGNYPSFYVDFGNDRDEGAKKRSNLSHEMLKLGTRDGSEVIRINYISIEHATELRPEEQPVDFDIFFSEGLVRSAMRGEKALVESLLRVVNINYQESTLQQTALHFALRNLVKSRASFEQSDLDCETFNLEHMLEIKEVIQLLINFDGINFQTKDSNHKTAVMAAIDQLPTKQSPQKMLSANAEKAEKIIEEVFLMLQSKGLKIDIESIERKGYPAIANMLKERPEQTVVEARNDVANKRPASPASSPYGFYVANSSAVSFENCKVVSSEQIDDALLGELKKQLATFMIGFIESHHCSPKAVFNCLPSVAEEMRQAPPISPPRDGKKL
jgi:hypothetical protein